MSDAEGEKPDCLYQLRGRVDNISWRNLSHPYCEEISAIRAAEMLTAHYPCVQVINLATGGVVHEATRRARN